MLVRSLSVALVVGALAGCAFGGGRGDAGPGGPTLMDVGPPARRDAGPRIVAVDAGPPGDVDAGPGGGVDAGPQLMDAGGIDAGPPACSESPCRLVSPQCGCPGAQGCFVDDTTNQRACGPRGPETEGQACSGPSSCQSGLMCIGSEGFCARFCDSDADCPGGPGSICGITLSDGMGGSVPNATLCTVHCDPLNGSGCPAAQGCAVFRETSGAMRGFTSCRPAGTTPTWGLCATEEECRTGHICVNNGFGRECTPLCRDSFDCGILEICRPFSPALRVGSVEYGFCE